MVGEERKVWVLLARNVGPGHRNCNQIEPAASIIDLSLQCTIHSSFQSLIVARLGYRDSRIPRLHVGSYPILLASELLVTQQSNATRTPLPRPALHLAQLHQLHVCGCSFASSI